MITRLGPDGYGVKRTSAFSGKTPDDGSGERPVDVLSRLGLDGYGVKRAGSFGGKTVDDAAGEHPVSIITRLGLDGYGSARAGDFSGKTQTAAARSWSRSDYETARKLQRDPVWVTARLVDDDDTLSATVETIALPAVVALGDVEVFAGLQDEPDTLTAYIETRWPDVAMVVTPKMIRAPKMVRTPELIRS